MVQGLDLNPLISFANRITDSQRRLAETLLATSNLTQQLSHPPHPPPSNEPPVVQEPSHLVNTEGLTEAQNHENEEAAFDQFMKEIDEVLEADDSDDETVRAAPSHHPEISAEVMHSLWKQAREEDSDQ